VLRFAQAVAVLGETGLTQAAALVAIDPDKARKPADALVRSGILRDDAVIGFAEPLMRAAVYDTLSSLECAALHQRAAELLLEAAPDADAADEARIADHLLRSQPAGQSRFREVLHAVAGERTRAGAFGDARRLLERALGEADDEARGEILTELADTELRLGCVDAAVAHASEALGLRLAPSVRATACAVAAHSLALTAGTPAALAMLAAESERIGGRDVDLQLRLRATAATLRACAGVPSDPAEVDVSATLAGTTPAERALLAVRAADHVLGATGSALDVRELCVRVLGAEGDADATATYFAGFAALHADAIDLVESLLEDDPVDAEITADAAVARLALGSQLAFARGELDRARRVALDVLEHVAATPDSTLARRVRTDTLAVLVLAALEGAHGEDARDALTELSEQDNANTFAVASLRVAVALSEDSLDAATEAARALEASPPGLAGVGLAGREWAALAWHAAGDRESALAHATAHLDRARLWGSASLLGSALTVRGVVAAGKEQIDLLEEAVAILNRTPASLALARATIELGSGLRRAGRRRDARERLVEAADLAYRCGAEALSARARSELVSVGARPRRATFSGIGALTASEHRVATLAAAGMTNRAIARELTVSAKTVSGQLSAVYRKLDVHDRAALAAVMAEVEASRNAVGADG
jgi:DNA-binding CsgD family transcriptional regulator